MNLKDIKHLFTSWAVVFLLVFLIITSCNKDNNTNVDFTIDLTQSQFSALQGFGGSVWYNGICIARSPVTGNYIAVSGYCTVDGQVLTFNASGDYFICPLQHEFSEAGIEINDPSAGSLISYHTQLINNFLRIYAT